MSGVRNMRDQIAWLLVRCIVGLVALTGRGGVLVWIDLIHRDDLMDVVEIVGTVFCFVGPVLTAILGYYFRAPN